MSRYSQEPSASSVQWFIFVHACSLVDRGDWTVAARVTLEKVERFKAQADQPPIMRLPQWEAIEQDIRAIAQGVSDGCL